MSIILSIGHDYALAINDLKKAGSFVESKVLPVLQAVHADAPAIEAVSGILSPSLISIEKIGDEVLGAVIAALVAAGEAQKGGLSVSLSEEIVADIKSILGAVKAAV